ncbi:MAG: 6-phospho-beta-glucosidase [Anaerolineae bacterium]|nr:6-phospho-beta-glucosidase [Anaerolineae bacterium]
MKLTIIGGGSVRTPRLIPSLVRRTAALKLDEVWLMDIDGDKLELIASLCRSMADEQGAAFRLVTTTDARLAIQDADAVITSIRPGKEQGRATDERIAMRHGVLGQETTGAAGFAMAIRSLPAILDYARMVEDIAAPGAWIYNFTNPAGLVAQGLTYAGIKRVVGICDSANGAQHAVSRFMHIPMKHVRHSVYGLNHLSWTASVRIDPDPDGSGGEEVLPGLLQDERFIQATHMAMFDPGLIAWEKAFLNEYLHYFYHRDEALAALMDKTETRGEETLRLTNDLLARLHDASNMDAARAAYAEVMGRRSATYMAHARHGQDRVKMEPIGEDEEGYAAVALGCIQAISTGETLYTGLNVPNRGAIPQMLDDDVVEVTCRVNADNITPLPVTGIHDDQLLLMQSVKLYERLASRAILERSRELAYEALTVHPLIGSYPLAKALTDEFLEAHRDLVGEWA